MVEGKTGLLLRIHDSEFLNTLESEPARMGCGQSPSIYATFVLVNLDSALESNKLETPLYMALCVILWKQEQGEKGHLLRNPL